LRVQIFEHFLIVGPSLESNQFHSVGEDVSAHERLSLEVYVLDDFESIESCLSAARINISQHCDLHLSVSAQLFVRTVDFLSFC